MIRYFTAPATIANLSVGFDCLGLALTQPREGLSIRATDHLDVCIDQIHGADLPKKSLTNTASVAALSVLKKLGHPFGVRFSLYKQVQAGSGLGSSATSAVLAAFATNTLANDPLSMEEVLECALDGEMIASGARHADNTAAALWGGLCLVSHDQNQANQVIQLPTPQWQIVLLYPHISIKTSAARQVLPTHVPLKDALQQTQAMAKFIHACYQQDDLQSAQVLHDYLVETHRIPLQAYFTEVRTCALAAGAINGGISGSGPTSFWICMTASTAEDVANSLTQLMQSYQIECDVYQSTIQDLGVQEHLHEIPELFLKYSV